MLYTMKNSIVEYSTHFRKMKINLICAWSVSSISWKKDKIYYFLIANSGGKQLVRLKRFVHHRANQQLYINQDTR